MNWLKRVLDSIGYGQSYLNTHWSEESANGWGKIYEEIVSQWNLINQTWKNITKIFK